MNSTIKIETERLRLRNLFAQDAQRFFEYKSLPEVGKYQGWIPSNVKDAEDFISKYSVISPESWLQLGITLKDSSELIGDCGIHFTDEDFKQIEIGFTLDPAYQGKGYATEAVKGLLDYIFNTLNAHRVYGSCDPENTASIKLMERIGMRKEAHLKESIWFKNRWADDVIYGILKKEWR